MTQDSSKYPSFYSPWEALKPTIPLPPHYTPFESLANDLVSALDSKTFRPRLLALPIFTVDHLTSRHHWLRAFLILSVLGQAYVWGKDDEVLDVIPLNISVAWAYIAKKLGSKPVITYLAVEFLNYKVLLSLSNFEVLDPSLPLTLEYPSTRLIG
jgi:indoleamine 2,3-dioxygenase